MKFKLNYIVLGLFIFSTIVGSASPSELSEGDSPVLTKTESTLYWNFEGRTVNNNSRVNPGNNVTYFGSVSNYYQLYFTASSYLNSNKDLRVLFKTYNFAEFQSKEVVSLSRLDELFTDYDGGSWIASIGKRRLNWGQALAFNPVNVIVPPRDPLNRYQETEGQPMAWLRKGNDLSTMDLVLSRDFDAAWNSSLNRWGGRLASAIKKGDFAFYLYDGDQYSNGDPYERMLGFSFSSVVRDGVTLYSEIANFGHNYRNYYNSASVAEKKEKPYFQGVIGSYLILPPTSFLSFLNGEANLILEFYHNGQGYDEQERKNYYTALDQTLAVGNPSVLGDYQFTGMNQNYFLFNYSNSFLDIYTLRLRVLLAQDGSIYSTLTDEINLSDYFTVIPQFSHVTGDRNSEFGNNPLSNIFKLSLRANF